MGRSTAKALWRHLFADVCHGNDPNLVLAKYVVSRLWSRSASDNSGQPNGKHGDGGATLDRPRFYEITTLRIGQIGDRHGFGGLL